MKSTEKRIFLILTIIILISLFSIRSYYVVEDSMYPTIKEGNRVITLNFGIINSFLPKRNMIIVFTDPTNEDRNLIKRVVATEGDIIFFQEDTILVNGKTIPMKVNIKNTEVEEIEMPPNKMFVIGDNPSYSIDSRDFGFIEEKDIKGFVIIKI